MIRTKKPIAIVTDIMNPQEIKNVILNGYISDSTWYNDFNSLTINFEYFYEDEGLKKSIKTGVYRMDREDIDSLDSLIEEVGEGKTAKERNLFEQAFMLIMSKNYNIPLNNIEIV